MFLKVIRFLKIQKLVAFRLLFFIFLVMSIGGLVALVQEILGKRFRAPLYQSLIAEGCLIALAFLFKKLVSRELLNIKRPPLHPHFDKVMLLLFVIFVVVLIPASISRSNSTARKEAPIKQNIELVDVMSNVYWEKNRSFGSSQDLVNFLNGAKAPLQASTGRIVKSSNEVSVETDHNGQQLILVTPGIADCLGLLENKSKIQSVKSPLIPTEVGTYHANWIVSTPGVTHEVGLMKGCGTGSQIPYGFGGLLRGLLNANWSNGW
jgi:hypothetical protein